MKPWNRLRNIVGRLIGGGDALPASGDAIYLTETAYRNHRPATSKAPEIRERHFGLGSGRKRAQTSDMARRPRGGWLARLGFRGEATDESRDGYGRTKIVGTPHPPAPSPAPASIPTPTPIPTQAPAPAPVPVPAFVPAPPPASAAPAPYSGKKKKTAAPFSGNDAEMLRNLFGEPPPEPLAQAAPEPRPAPAAPSVAPPAPRSPGAPVAAPVAVKRKRKKMDRSDLTVAALGVTLAAICAIFPWYIFFNQEKFGVREFVFSGAGGSSRPTGLLHIPQPIGKPFTSKEVPSLALDFFPTATLPADEAAPRSVPASEQPFPADRLSFRLVHVANGRAMIEDGDGLWVVQRGSQLPDASRVVAIEQRKGRWVILTSGDKIIELDAN